MKRFFSHLPDWVDWSACGISRASANSIAIACSAVVIELPNGVFMTTMPRARGGGHVDRVDADPGAADHLQAGQGGVHRRGVDPGRAAHGEAVVIADDRLELVGRQAGLLVDVDAALAEDRRGLAGPSCRR